MNVNRGLAASQFADGGFELLHRGGIAQNAAAVRVIFIGFGSVFGVFAAGKFERGLDEFAQFGQIYRFGYEVVSPGFEGFYCRIHAAKRGNDRNRDVRVIFLNVTHNVDAVTIG